jgi:hypothetical protein
VEVVFGSLSLRSSLEGIRSKLNVGANAGERGIVAAALLEGTRSGSRPRIAREN